jgi:hypothetical protein
MTPTGGTAPALDTNKPEDLNKRDPHDRLPRLAVQVTALLLAASGIVLVVWLRPEALKFWEFTKDDIVRLFTELIVIALIIERGVEVFITPWRQGDRTKLEIDLQSVAPDARMEKKQNLAKYKHETRQVAFLVSLAIGIVISAAGIRVLQFLIQPQTLEKISNTNQGLFFVGLDVLLTGALLGGGADALHKLVSVFTNFMDTSAAKAAKGNEG